MTSYATTVALIRMGKRFMVATSAPTHFPYPHRTLAEVWSPRHNMLGTLSYVAKHRRLDAYQRMRLERLAKEWKGD